MKRAAKHKGITKRRYKNIPGVIVECKSGRYLAWYEHRTDIIANGENEVDVKKNLKIMYDVVMKHEKEEQEEKKPDPLPPSFKTRAFTEKVPA